MIIIISTKLFHEGGPYQIETSPLICKAMLYKSMDWFLYNKDFCDERVIYNKVRWLDGDD